MVHLKKRKKRKVYEKLKYFVQWIEAEQGKEKITRDVLYISETMNAIVFSLTIIKVIIKYKNIPLKFDGYWKVSLCEIGFKKYSKARLKTSDGVLFIYKIYAREVF